MNTKKLLDNLREEAANTREIFENVRNQQTNHFSLRLRLALTVTGEMLVCIAIAYGIDALFENVFQLDVQIPLLVELIAVCLIVGMLVTSLLSKSFFNPIKKLRKAMERVADGDFTVQLDPRSSSKEILEIYSGFNLMVHELAATEILQTDFVSNVSHEFKTPINAIEGYSTLLQSSENLDAEQKQYVEKIIFNTERLSSLVGSILLLSKLENKQISTGKSLYRLDEQIRQSVVALEPSWEKKNIELDVELDRVEYNGNESMMRHVWDNLIGNAIKFSPCDSIVEIRLVRQNDYIIFTVSDCGPGLSEEAQKHMFDKFYQADSSHKEEGNGLGLALVNRILSIEKGQIEAKNLDRGGCQFTVLLRANTF